jgi:aspartyl-tRNA synthetase
MDDAEIRKPVVDRAAGSPTDESSTDFYRRYNERCNAHDFDRLDEFVAADVLVNGEVQGLRNYIAGLGDVVRAFPDYRWELRHLLVDGPWISAHFQDTGTHQGTFLGVPPTGRRVETQEFAIYRVVDGKFAEVWVTADNLGLLSQLTASADDLSR